LDTQVFKTNNFAFDSKSLELLKQLVQEDRASVFITEVVEHEVRARMKRELEASRPWFNNLFKESRILFSAPTGPLYKHSKKLDVDSLYAGMDAAFSSYLRQVGATVIECSGVSLSAILDGYYAVEPPFGPSDDKRREFPDAISIAAVSAHFNKSGAYVISADKGLDEACRAHKHLSYLTRLEDFLEAELADHEDVSWINAAISQMMDELEETVTKTFEETYFFLDDQEGEVEKVEVDDIELGEPALIETTSDEATISLDCLFRYTADISYDDPNMTIYSEGDRYSFGTVKEQVQREQREKLSVSFHLDRVTKEISDFYCSSLDSRAITAIEYYDPK
jgi:hypothetical protein